MKEELLDGIWRSVLLAIAATFIALLVANLAYAADFKEGQKVKLKEPPQRANVVLCYTVGVVGDGLLGVVPPEGAGGPFLSSPEKWEPCPKWAVDFLKQRAVVNRE